MHGFQCFTLTLTLTLSRLLLVHSTYIYQFNCLRFANSACMKNVQHFTVFWSCLEYLASRQKIKKMSSPWWWSCHQKWGWQWFHQKQCNRHFIHNMRNSAVNWFGSQRQIFKNSGITTHHPILKHIFCKFCGFMLSYGRLLHHYSWILSNNEEF